MDAAYYDMIFKRKSFHRYGEPDGKKITAEELEEIKTMWYAKPMALPEVKCYNPSFDVTDHELLTGIVTEKGIIYPPFDVNLKKLFNE